MDGSNCLGVASFSVGDSTEAVAMQLEAGRRRLAHTTEVLRESEATNARLSEQTLLLKASLRFSLSSALLCHRLIDLFNLFNHINKFHSIDCLVL